MREEFFDGRLVVKSGDITEEAVDAIVNAANWTLMGGCGVDGAIHSKGGPSIIAECRAIRESRFPNGLPTGEAVITAAGELPARFVIHTVGPIYGRADGRDAELLSNRYRNSIDLAVEHDLATIAFPSISTGAFGYPKHEAAKIVSATIEQSLSKHDKLQIILVFFSDADAQLFLKHSQLRTV